LSAVTFPAKGVHTRQSACTGRIAPPEDRDINPCCITLRARSVGPRTRAKPLCGGESPHERRLGIAQPPAAVVAQDVTRSSDLVRHIGAGSRRRAGHCPACRQSADTPSSRTASHRQSQVRLRSSEPPLAVRSDGGHSSCGACRNPRARAVDGSRTREDARPSILKTRAVDRGHRSPAGAGLHPGRGGSQWGGCANHDLDAGGDVESRQASA
jgi:hypothetical protein